MRRRSSRNVCVLPCRGRGSSRRGAWSGHGAENDLRRDECVMVQYFVAGERKRETWRRHQAEGKGARRSAEQDMEARIAISARRVSSGVTRYGSDNGLALCARRTRWARRVSGVVLSKGAGTLGCVVASFDRLERRKPPHERVHRRGER